MIKEIDRRGVPGFVMLAVIIALIGLAALVFIRSVDNPESPLGIVAGLLIFVLAMVAVGGLVVVNPNEARVLILFGNYVGSLTRDGFWWVNPFAVKKRVSRRVRNFETNKLKVNDNHSNPIEIAAVVVWRVVDTAEALFEVEDYENYVHVQSESAVRTLASRYPYDAHAAGDVALSSHQVEVSRDLLSEVQERLGKAGVQVTEARITHLAYAPEIASAMLQRQQASAIIAARQKIVEGAVGMVENALDLLSTRNIVQLDPERRAAMVSNLLVVLCSERGSQPVVNAGSLY
ncbi:MAG TPA: SPFH domain-containing protein [Gemmatimonadales bacterium]|nr:SPFH domain-containing protein [Gemmatimonadales bacterium]